MRLFLGGGRGGREDPKGLVGWGRKSTDLHLDIQNTDPLLLRHILYRLRARPVVVAPEQRVLDKPALGHQRQEFLAAREVVFAAVLLAGAGGARRVCQGISVVVGEVEVCGGRGKMVATDEIR